MKGRRAKLSSILVALGLVACLLAGTALLHQRAAQTKAASRYPLQPIPVAGLAVEAVEGYTVVDRFVGRIEPAQRARMAFERPGLVTRINVDEGQAVQRGDTLATLDTSLLLADRDRLQGQLKEVRARLQLARLLEERQRRLQRQGHVSEQLLDEARLGTQALIGTLAATEAALARVDLDIAKSVIKAPFNGIVGAREVDTGVVVNAGTPIIYLLETDRPQARVGLSPEAADTLIPGSPVTLRYRANPMQGRIAAIRPDVSTTTRTVGVLIDLPQVPPGSFGDTVELQLTRQVASPGFWIPVAALTEGEKGLWTVLTLKQDGDERLIVGQEVVELLHTDGERAYVRGTLRQGQRIIANGRNRVIPGQQVSLVAAP